MARIRTLKPEFWQDEKMAPLDATTRLVFVALISLADDAGRLLDNVRLLDASIFPETEESVREPLATLSRIGRVTRGKTASGQAILQITNWSRHQKVDHPNFKAALPEIVELESLKIAREPVANDSRAVREPLASHTNDLRPTTNDQRPTTKAARKRTAPGAAQPEPGVDIPPDGVPIAEWVPPGKPGDIGFAIKFSQDAEFVAFDGHEVLRRDHPRVLAHRVSKVCPSKPPLISANATDRFNVLWERWRFRVGEVAFSRWKRSAMDAFETHGMVKLWNAIEAFYEARLFATERDRQFLTFDKWLAELPMYIKWGMQPLEVNGKPTERHRRFTR